MMITKKTQKYYTYQLDMKVLNFLAILLFVIVGGIVYFIERNDPYSIHYSFSTLFIMLFFWLILHELLHALGFLLFREVDKKNITFGMFLERGVFYCMCKQKIGKKVILTSLVFPVLVIGVITLIIGMIFNQFELVYLSILNIVSSIGDIVMMIYFLKAPRDIIYLDLDDCTSFTVVSREDIESIRVMGIHLADKGIYKEEKMYSKDKRKVVISKASYFLIIFIFIFIMIRIIGGML